ncbi:peptide deformylase [Lacticaseibacillus sp. N501-2]|uniref:peptide deformylase n=1 Tax=Lacticaseibacillus salsurae TaxID=3367729 RepID=UPI0038B393F0
MIRPINHDPLSLSQQAKPATPKDQALIADLHDTLAAHRQACVGMAANMIGVNRAMIIASMGVVDMVLINPRIIAKSDPFDTTEGCLSLTGERACTRYREITVQYLDEQWHPQTRQFSDFFAQIIQHECDHLAGILI